MSKVNFKPNLNSAVGNEIVKTRDIAQKDIEENEKDSLQPGFVLEKKKKKKNTKKSFPLYMEEELVNELDKICNKTGYNRNELINKMVAYSLEYIEFK